MVKELKNQPQNTALASLKRHDEHWQALIRRIQAMTLMDDVFFNCFMEDDIKAMEYILNIIMNKNDLKVIHLKTQHSVPNIYGRSVRFDVFAIDQNGTEYNFEVQDASSGASPKKSQIQQRYA